MVMNTKKQEKTDFFKWNINFRNSEKNEWPLNEFL